MSLQPNRGRASEGRALEALVLHLRTLMLDILQPTRERAQPQLHNAPGAIAGAEATPEVTDVNSHARTPVIASTATTLLAREPMYTRPVEPRRGEPTCTGHVYR